MCGAPLRQAKASLANIRPARKTTMNKRTSLFCFSVSDEETPSLMALTHQDETQADFNSLAHGECGEG